MKTIIRLVMTAAMLALCAGSAGAQSDVPERIAGFTGSWTGQWGVTGRGGWVIDSTLVVGKFVKDESLPNTYTADATVTFEWANGDKRKRVAKLVAVDGADVLAVIMFKGSDATGQLGSDASAEYRLTSSGTMLNGLWKFPRAYYGQPGVAGGLGWAKIVGTFTKK